MPRGGCTRVNLLWKAEENQICRFADWVICRFADCGQSPNQQISKSANQQIWPASRLISGLSSRPSRILSSHSCI
jgi:hypothetical protein